MLPLRHLEHPPDPAPVLDQGDRPLASVLGELRRSRAAGADWRCLVESVKAVGNDLWRGFTDSEREQFVRHVARYWEVSRHRMAPPMAALVDELLAAGRLRVVAGGVETAQYAAVVNCTGPAPVSTIGWSTLVDRLSEKAVLRPGPLGLGVHVDAEGALVAGDGTVSRGLFAVGAARRGTDWEVAAVPDIRRQAQRLVPPVEQRLGISASAQLPQRLVG